MQTCGANFGKSYMTWLKQVSYYRGALLEEENDVTERHGFAWIKFPEQLVEGKWERQGRKNKGNRQANQRRAEQKKMREEEKEENETMSAKRRCVGSFSAEASDTSSVKGEIWRVVVVFLGVTCWRIMMTCECRAVTVVLVSHFFSGGHNMGPKRTNCCRPEQMDTNEFVKIMKRIQILEEGRVPAKKAKNWNIEGEKKRITRKEQKKLLNNFEMGG